MGLILGLFLLICFFTPIRVDFLKFRIGLIEAQNMQNQIAVETDKFFFRTAIQKSQVMIEENIYHNLANYGIKPDEVEIYIETLEDKLNQRKRNIIVYITLPSRVRWNHREIHKILQYELGMEVQLTYQEENL